MNACQAVVKPNCSKPKVGKSVGMKKALTDILIKSIEKIEQDVDKTSVLEERNMLHSSVKSIPKNVSDSVSIATIEFAGVKFKTKASSGSQYLKYVEGGVIMRSAIQFPNVKRLAICEEKYSYTPDSFKAATRLQRQKEKNVSILHLKTANEILTIDKFDKNTIVSTSEGKNLVSTYLARNINKLSIPRTITVDIDSEFIKSECGCSKVHCICDIYTHPIQVHFPINTDYTILRNIKQKKGEAEMAQIDWLIEYCNLLKEGESCSSIVTSGDIDSVVLHLFALAHLWPQLHLDRLKFRNDVYVILQKPGGTYDIYNITAILSLLEQAWKDEFVGQKLSIALSLGGNDYLPKFYGISHQATVELVFNNENFFKKLFKITFSENSELNIAFSTEHYIEFVKYQYTPKRLNPYNFTYNEIRQLSIKPPTQTVPRNPQLWMPPASAIRLLSKNVQCLIAYYLTAGRHSAAAPNFLLDGCLMKMKNGDVEYDLGAEAHTDNIDTCTQTDQEILQDKLSKARLKPTKRKPENTPQKGRRRKMKPMTSTPRKSEV